ncbi:Uncharacterised protein [uncultured archaeon]|nr:Uncharacterised protein [uncultured archaeon]
MRECRGQAAEQSDVTRFDRRCSSAEGGDSVIGKVAQLCKIVLAVRRRRDDAHGGGMGCAMGAQLCVICEFCGFSYSGTSKDVNNREMRRGKVAVEEVAECVQPTCTVIVGRV